MTYVRKLDADMKERLPLFSSHLRIGITEDELYGFEEITLSRAIAPDNDVMLRREGFGDSLILVAVKLQRQELRIAHQTATLLTS